MANTSTSTKQTSSSDLQVIIHEGGPRVTQKYPEAVWVSITACENNVFQGRVLNVPSQLDSIKQNDIISFLANTGGQYAVMTTAKYLRERPQWKIHPCSKCGFSELFDAPSDLVRATFPSLPDDAFVDASLHSAHCVMERRLLNHSARSAGGNLQLVGNQVKTKVEMQINIRKLSQSGNVSTNFYAAPTAS